MKWQSAPASPSPGRAGYGLNGCTCPYGYKKLPAHRNVKHLSQSPKHRLRASIAHAPLFLAPPGGFFSFLHFHSLSRNKNRNSSLLFILFYLIVFSANYRKSQYVGIVSSPSYFPFPCLSTGCQNKNTPAHLRWGERVEKVA